MLNSRIIKSRRQRRPSNNEQDYFTKPAVLLTMAFLTWFLWTTRDQQQHVLTTAAETTVIKEMGKIADDMPNRSTPSSGDDWLQQIVDRWNLTSPQAMVLLKKAQRLPSYSQEKDFIFLQHIQKTGGTSISKLLLNVFGPGIMPGSQVSGSFSLNLAQQELLNQTSDTTTSNYKAGYAHASVRKGGLVGRIDADAAVLAFLQDTFPERRIRAMTMIRDPVALRASNMNMFLCQNDQLLGHYSRSTSDPNCSISLSELQDLRQERLEPLCPRAFLIREQELNTSRSKTPSRYYVWCNRMRMGQDPFPECRSAAALLNSSSLYKKDYHNMHLHVFGRFVENQTTLKETATIEPYQVEEYTLQQLGSSSGGGDGGDDKDDVDFVWFGITERMSESLCLLFHTLRLDTPPRTQEKELVMKCRPTNWWTPQDRAEVELREPLDYALYRAANALMDVRLAEMQRRLEEEDASPQVGPECLKGN